MPKVRIFLFLFLLAITAYSKGVTEGEKTESLEVVNATTNILQYEVILSNEKNHGYSENSIVAVHASSNVDTYCLPPNDCETVIANNILTGSDMVVKNYIRLNFRTLKI